MTTSPNITIKKNYYYAVFPTLSQDSNGYDLTILATRKSLDLKTRVYDTGLKVTVEDGYYLEFVADANLIKNGIRIVNYFGQIDSSKPAENIYIVLEEVNDSNALSFLDLPLKCCKFIVKPKIVPKFTLVQCDIK